MRRPAQPNKMKKVQTTQQPQPKKKGVKPAMEVMEVNSGTANVLDANSTAS